jgi:hypothetical protein
MKVFDFDDMRANGFDMRDYSGDPLPDGSWIGTLKFRVWGKDRKCIHCLFVDTDGDKRKVAAFPVERGQCFAIDGAFTPRDGSVDFAADDLEEQHFGLTTGKSKTGKPAWLSATADPSF